MLLNPLPEVERWSGAIPAAIISVPWVWLAVRTKSCLSGITRRAAPHSTRTIWLIKILALIVGAGNVFGAFATLGLPWVVALAPAILIVGMAFSEKVAPIVVVPPPQTEHAYKSSWEEYRRLRTRARNSLLAFGLASLSLISTGFVSRLLPHGFRAVIWTVLAIAVLVSYICTSIFCLNVQRWLCPRCGRFFRGFWTRLWMPQHCVYCGLPSWTEVPGSSHGNQ